MYLSFSNMEYEKRYCKMMKQVIQCTSEYRKFKSMNILISVWNIIAKTDVGRLTFGFQNLHSYNRASETSLIAEWIVVTRKSLLWKICNVSQIFLILVMPAYTAEPHFFCLKIRSCLLLYIYLLISNYNPYLSHLKMCQSEVWAFKDVKQHVQ